MENTTGLPGNTPANDPMEDLIFQCLERMREEGEQALETILSTHPEHAQAVRNYIQSLKKVGLLETAPDRAEGAAADGFGDFRLLRCLGSGGMGAVHLAHQESLGRRVALKIIKPEFLHHAGALERFRREARAAARLNDPGICRVYEAGEVEGTPYIAMQYVEGETLAEQIKNKRDRLEPGATKSTTGPALGSSSRREIMTVVHCIEKVARALHSAHEQGLVHRDIKPANIMISKEGEPVLLDFGLVREERTDQLTLTHTGDVLGTPAYLSPEQISPRGMRPDRRTDVYSLGATLFECLTLERPFQASTREDLYRRILSTDLPNPSRLNRHVSGDLKVVLETAMDRDPDRRYATALAFADDLHRIRLFEPIRARRAGPVLRLRRWTRRNPVAATALALLTLGIAINSWLYLAAEASRDRIEKGLHQSDYFLLTGLEVEAGQRLWPARESVAPIIEVWLQHATDLIQRNEGYQRELAALRKRALPYTRQMEMADREAHRWCEALDGFKEERRRLGKKLAAAVPGPEAESLKKELAVHDVEIERLEKVVGTRRTWTFAHEADSRRHTELSRLVAKFETFGNKDPEVGTLASVKRNLDKARSIYRDTVLEYAKPWKNAIASIADREAHPPYGGLQIEPQVGLVPIGPDPGSGLWEFAHPESGEIPTRGPDGKLQLAEASSLVFVLLPGGTFAMGASRDKKATNHDPFALADEAAVHEMTLDPFFLSKYEMTQAQWIQLTGFNPAAFNPDFPLYKSFSLTLRHPVESVHWEESQRLLNRYGLQLPTEAQWEYAARSGKHTVWGTGDAMDSLKRKVNLRDKTYHYEGSVDPVKDTEDGFPITAPVGSFPPNAFGFHDMVGNLTEWCLDKFGRYYLPEKPGTGERIVPRSELNFVVLRGGSYYLYPENARIARRHMAGRRGFASRCGIRPARALE